jgi:hypothetical protein
VTREQLEQDADRIEVVALAMRTLDGSASTAMKRLRETFVLDHALDERPHMRDAVKELGRRFDNLADDIEDYARDLRAAIALKFGTGENKESA